MSEDTTRRHGNDQIWADIPAGAAFGQQVEIWRSIGLGMSETIALAADKFVAIEIVDALIRLDTPGEQR